MNERRMLRDRVAMARRPSNKPRATRERPAGRRSESSADASRHAAARTSLHIRREIRGMLPAGLVPTLESVVHVPGFSLVAPVR